MNHFLLFIEDVLLLAIIWMACYRMGTTLQNPTTVPGANFGVDFCIMTLLCLAMAATQTAIIAEFIKKCFSISSKNDILTPLNIGLCIAFFSFFITNDILAFKGYLKRI
jgi:hypothetical protein